MAFSSRNIKSEGDHNLYKAKGDKTRVIQRMTREERMAALDVKNNVVEKDSDDDLDSDWSDSSDDDSSDDYSESDPDASKSGSSDDDSDEEEGKVDKEETPAQKKKRLKKEAKKRRLANRPTYRDKFDDWRERRAKERRHPTLGYYEKLMRKEQRKADRLAEEAEDKRIEVEQIQREEWRQRQEDEDFLAYAKEVDEKRYRLDRARRTKEMENTMCRMTLFEKWDLENGVINRKRQKESDDKEKADKEADAKLADTTFREAKAHNAELLRLEQEADTQSALRTMRRAGMIAGVNPPKPDARGLPNETDIELLLKIKAHVQVEETKEEPMQQDSRSGRRAAIKQHQTKKKEKEKSHFEVELSRFRNVEKIQGSKLGPLGVRYLITELVKGACPRLATLDLGWNRIGRQGVQFLSDGFKRKCCPNLVRLDLRANLLLPNALEVLMEGLNMGDVKLRVLDLRANALKDEGGCVVASLALAGAFESLEELHLQSNDIRSKGLWALFQAFQAVARDKLFPNMVHVSARYNKAAPDTLRQMRNCPPWIAF